MGHKKSHCLLTTAFILLCSIFIASIACAYGTVNTEKVEKIRVDKDGRGIVTFLDLANPIACSVSAYNKSMAFDTNTAGGKALLSLLVSAQLSGKSIYARGTGFCDIYNGYVEDISYAVMVE